MAYWPVALDVARRPVVVVGATAAAEAKIRRLLPTRAQVVVIAPHLTPSMKAWGDSGKITLQERDAVPGDLQGAALVIAAGPGREGNRQVARWARSLGALVNCPDDPAFCDCLSMAMVRKGPLTVAVSTGGRSPALARYVRQRLETLMDPLWAELVERAADLRTQVCHRWTFHHWEEWIEHELAAISRPEAGERPETGGTGVFGGRRPR